MRSLLSIVPLFAVAACAGGQSEVSAPQPGSVTRPADNNRISCALGDGRPIYETTAGECRANRGLVLIRSGDRYVRPPQ
jgi:hypothetical protein